MYIPRVSIAPSLCYWFPPHELPTAGYNLGGTIYSLKLCDIFQNRIHVEFNYRYFRGFPEYFDDIPHRVRAFVLQWPDKQENGNPVRVQLDLRPYLYRDEIRRW